LSIVATGVGGVPEVIVDGETGLIVQVGSVDALADAITRLISDSSLRARVGSNARQQFDRSGWSAACSLDSVLASYQKARMVLRGGH